MARVTRLQFRNTVANESLKQIRRTKEPKSKFSATSFFLTVILKGRLWVLEVTEDNGKHGKGGGSDESTSQY